MPDETKCYKIRDDRYPGLWKMAGYGSGRYAFTKNGKTWSSKAAVSGHLALHANWETGQIPVEILGHWEIVEYTETDVISVKNYLKDRKKKNGKTTKPTEL